MMDVSTLLMAASRLPFCLTRDEYRSRLWNLWGSSRLKGRAGCSGHAGNWAELRIVMDHRIVQLDAAVLPRVTTLERPHLSATPADDHYVLGAHRRWDDSEAATAPKVVSAVASRPWQRYTAHKGRRDSVTMPEDGSEAGDGGTNDRRRALG